jgi:PleD family two-component response regulator
VGVSNPASLLKKADEMLYNAKKQKQQQGLETTA